MADIFLSYTEQDRDIARRMAAMLGSVGWTVWWDRRIPAGETWRSVLEHALENMRCMVVLWSAQSIESEWVYEEASEGRRQSKLVPVLIEAVRPPAGFREIQAADLTGWDGSREFEGVNMLLADLENILGKPVAGAANGALAAHETVRERSGTAADRGRPYNRADLHGGATTVERAPLRNLPIWAVAGALLLAAGAAYFGRSGRETAVTPPVTEAARPYPDRASAPAETPPTASPRPAPPLAAAPRALPESAPAPARSPTLKRSDPARAASAGCADLLARVQLGETLSDEAQSRFRKECRQ